MEIDHRCYTGRQGYVSKHIIPYYAHRDSPQTNPLSFDKYIWNKDLSAEKLTNALQSREFHVLKTDILNKNYEFSTLGTKHFTHDVEKITTFLHEQCCDKIKVGKNKSKFKNKNAKRKPWFTPDCQSLRKRARRAANYFSRHPF